ncbi:class I SAM-dependent methyltransferase [Acidocella sp. KAb 2-4]|uniref:class I SAM-dependent methyltransferase n=1 Tax=Acidocella sp. KAb 2-4 TaxID=2885158 RepID=UPI001D0926F0|nr:SAM-dependent methyltransferase [Acidocella sp. KAb 2-4]MCB5945082.1 SAM-dependent methyltransferase [Acidocella sp. KAb 2-4]
MARANAAYYARGAFTADFVTAPELTQVFGELLGAWAKVVWQMLGAPADVRLVEAGPGRGVLMADALRVWNAPDVHFIEASPALRAEQAKRVPRATWHDSLESIPPGPMILLANEFLDALPVRQFIRREAGWMERYVADGAYVELPAEYPLPDDPVGSLREVNEAALAFCRKLAARGAVGLFIDYGPMRSAPGESVQAIRHGEYADPLQHPGEADITAHVDFGAIKAAVHAQGPVKQNAFLTALGLYQRSDVLARRHPEKAEALRLSVQRLTAPEAMGSLFKVIAVCPEGLPGLPGFA